MAIVTRRYSFVGPSNTDLAEFASPTAIQNTKFPYTVIDVDIDDSVAGVTTALDEYMSSIGWSFDPTAVAGEVGKVKVTSNDTTPEFLLEKLVAGTNISLVEQNDGGDESILISATDTDEKVKASANDTTPDYLFPKLAAGTGITITELNDGGNETVEIAASDVDDDKVKVSANDTTADYLGGKVVGGSGITVTELNDGGDEDLEIKAEGLTTSNITTAAPDDLAAGDASAEGVATSLSRSDHQHGVPVGAPVSTGGANGSGAATSFSRSDHVHVGTVEVEDEGVSVSREPVINFLGAGVNAVAGTGKIDVTIPGGAGDELVKISANDTTSDYLLPKLVAGTNVTLTEQNDGGNENIKIDATDTNDDEKVKISANDTTPDYLGTKLVAGDGVTLTELNDGLNETLKIDSPEKIKVTSNDTTPDYLLPKLQAGANITINEINDGGNEKVEIVATDTNDDEKVKISANDTTAGYLGQKVVGGSGITVTELNDGADEDLEIKAEGLTTANITTAAPDDLAAGDASAEGVSTSLARADHQHGVPTAAPVKTATANAEGVATSFSRSDHVHQTALEIEDEGISQGDAHTTDFVGAGVSVAVVGNVATVTIPGDLTPGFATPDALAAGDASAEGVAATIVRSDHQHGVPTAAPVSTGGANAEGAATTFSRSDHVHVGTVEVEDEGVSVSREPVINFLGAGVTAAAGTGKVDVTIPGGGGLATKAGCEPAGNFAGSPKKATITFATPFPDANYAVNITAVTTNDASFDPAVGSKLAGSFVIMLGSASVNNLTEICWIAVANGETT